MNIERKKAAIEECFGLEGAEWTEQIRDTPKDLEGDLRKLGFELDPKDSELTREADVAPRHLVVRLRGRQGSATFDRFVGSGVYGDDEAFVLAARKHCLRALWVNAVEHASMTIKEPTDG